MASKSKKRQLTPNTYKLIHSKSANLLVKKVAAELQKESEYFPAKITKKEMPNFFDPSNSINLSNKQLSQSSRYISRNPHLGQSMKQQLNLRQKEIQALRRELKHVQKKALEKQDKLASIRKLESELAQTYRVIQFYEAKILQLQKICIMYEQSLDSTLRSTKHQKISLILEEFRRENVELRIQLEQRMKANTLMTKQVGDLAVAKVQLEQKLKQLSKKMHNEMLIGSHTAKPKKFIDEYERQHLALANPNDSAKKRPLLPRKNKVKLTSGQSESEQSSTGAEYKNNIYVKRDFKRPTSKKDDSLQGRMKSKMYGNLSSKINSIEVEMQTLKKQNERLQQQLDIKLNDTFHIKKISQQLEMKVNVLEETIKLSKESKAERMPQKIVISKSMIKEIAKPQPEKSQSSKLPPSNPTQNKLSMFVSNISPHQSSISPSTSSQQVSGGKKAQIAKKPKKTNYQFIEIKQKTLRKLVIHLTKSEVAYESILDTLAQFWSGNDPNGLMGQLQNAPYNLSPQETAEFMFEYKQIIKYISGKESEQAIKDMNEEQYRKYISSEIKKVLEDNISCFKNITFRRQFSLNIQLANKFKNYESQFQQLANKYQNRIPFKECQQVFVKEWGLTEEQFMCLIVNNYEENGDLQFVQLEEIGRNYLSQ